MNTSKSAAGAGRFDRPFLLDAEFFERRPKRFFRLRQWREEDAEDYDDYHGGPHTEASWFAVAFRDGDFISQRFCPPESPSDAWIYRIRVASWALGCARAWLEDHVFRPGFESPAQ